ncbi:MAG: HipA domain-containing protein, partial [Bacteroidota bacterium]
MTERIKVKLAVEGQDLEVGTLVTDQARIYFRCSESYLNSDLDISPFKLAKTRAIQQADTPVFAGLHGVFADALPDGWGRLLLDRALAEKGVDLSTISPLDRLAYVGASGMGALTFHPEREASQVRDNSVDLDRVATAAANILSGQASDILEKLVEMGGSSGGARPKILVGYNPKTDEILSSTEVLPTGFEHWLIKFPAAIDPEDVANIEYAYHKLALLAGLEMMPCRLFMGKSGRQYFGTKRFDRVGNQRLHLHSAAGLMHDNFRLSNMDYGHVMDAALRLEESLQGPAKVLRLAAFN